MPAKTYTDMYKAVQKMAHKGKEILIGSDKKLISLLKEVDKMDVLLYKSATVENITKVYKSIALARREVQNVKSKQNRGLPYDKGLADLNQTLSKSEDVCQNQLIVANKEQLVAAGKKK